MVSAWDLIGSTSYSYFLLQKENVSQLIRISPRLQEVRPATGRGITSQKAPNACRFFAFHSGDERDFKGREFQKLVLRSVSSCLQPELPELLKLQRISSYQDCLASDITINCEIMLQMCMSYLLKQVRGRKGWIIFFPLKFSFQNVSGKRALSNLTSCKAHTASSVSCNNLYRA